MSPRWRKTVLRPRSAEYCDHAKTTLQPSGTNPTMSYRHVLTRPSYLRKCFWTWCKILKLFMHGSFWPLKRVDACYMKAWPDDAKPPDTFALSFYCLILRVCFLLEWLHELVCVVIQLRHGSYCTGLNVSSIAMEELVAEGFIHKQIQELFASDCDKWVKKVNRQNFNARNWYNDCTES